eukprot:TRINITY_DN15547_c0_g1_i1.p2 TRINITY_DN15547_c0_g1~~TRINITY_DN15547_c0_g1_i1.p2  ORF type:complete len:402 (-),score=88.37 TRINITY_DN15547_c0_g1_i1:49-1254(-)
MPRLTQRGNALYLALAGALCVVVYWQLLPADPARSASSSAPRCGGCQCATGDGKCPTLYREVVARRSANCSLPTARYSEGAIAKDARGPGVLVTLIGAHEWFQDRAPLLRRMVRSVDRYYPFKLDVIVFHDGLNSTQRDFITANQTRRISFEDVSRYFVPTPEELAMPWTGCDRNTLGYRLMCRFFSGPVFQLPVLGRYKYIWRLDTDSELGADVPWDVFQHMEEGPYGSVSYQMPYHYGFALEDSDNSDCQFRLHEAVERFADSCCSDERPLIRFSRMSFNNDSFLAPTHHVYNTNFEIINLDFFRHPHYQAYFNFLNSYTYTVVQHGVAVNVTGFVSSRWGDHIVKTLYVDLFDDMCRIRCFHDIGYDHSYTWTNCNHNWRGVVPLDASTIPLVTGPRT